MEMKSMKIDNKIKSIISTPVPDYLIQERKGGGNTMLKYLSGSTIIDMLNDAFGYAWSSEVKKEWIEQSTPYFNGYSKSPEKVNYLGRDGAWEEQGPVAHVLITLTVYLQVDGGVVELKKDGYGSKSILGKQNDQESIFKAAGTDALKKAASLFGIGLELYRNEEEKYYFDSINYIDPWTDELKEEHKEHLDYLETYKTTNGVLDEEWSTFIAQVSGDSYVVTPGNISKIANYIAEATAE